MIGDHCQTKLRAVYGNSPVIIQRIQFSCTPQGAEVPESIFIWKMWEILPKSICELTQTCTHCRGEYGNIRSHLPERTANRPQDPRSHSRKKCVKYVQKQCQLTPWCCFSPVFCWVVLLGPLRWCCVVFFSFAWRCLSSPPFGGAAFLPSVGWCCLVSSFCWVVLLSKIKKKRCKVKGNLKTVAKWKNEK